jgi:signal peptidase I
MLPNSEKKHGFWYHLFDVLLNIAIIVAIVAGVRTFLVSPFQVEGNSMVDTLADKEYIIINKLVYFTGSPQRGDVVVFRPPTDHDKYYVKRIIGLPGDEVTIRDGFVFLRKAGEAEERKLDETGYLNEKNLGHTYRHPPNGGDQSAVSYTVPKGEYFVLGDNRQGSLDSRSFQAQDEGATAFVTQDDIKGRVWFIALPLTKIHALALPEYGF